MIKDTPMTLFLLDQRRGLQKKSQGYLNFLNMLQKKQKLSAQIKLSR